MNVPEKLVTAAVAAATIAAIVWLRPGELAPNPEPPTEPTPLTITVCCESWPGGKCYDMPIGDCPPSHDLTSCCAPSSNADGSVSCGC